MNEYGNFEDLFFVDSINNMDKNLIENHLIKFMEWVYFQIKAASKIRLIDELNFSSNRDIILEEIFKSANYFLLKLLSSIDRSDEYIILNRSDVNNNYILPMID